LRKPLPGARPRFLSSSLAIMINSLKNEKRGKQFLGFLLTKTKTLRKQGV
jgi:hypothetical protein